MCDNKDDDEDEDEVSDRRDCMADSHMLKKGLKKEANIAISSVIAPSRWLTYVWSPSLIDVIIAITSFKKGRVWSRYWEKEEDKESGENIDSWWCIKKAKRGGNTWTRCKKDKDVLMIAWIVWWAYIVSLLAPPGWIDRWNTQKQVQPINIVIKVDTSISLVYIKL